MRGILILLMLGSLPAAGAIAPVANVVGASADTSTATTAGIATTGASLLVAIVADYTGAVGTMSDSKSNTWAALTVSNSSGNMQVRIYYAANPTVGAGHTFTFTSTATTYPSISVSAWSGVALSSPFDVQSVASTSGNASSLSSGNITPGSAGELWIAATAHVTTTVAPTVGAVLNAKAYPGATGSYGLSVSYKIQSPGPATEQESFTYNPVGHVAVAIASFKPAPATCLFTTSSLPGGIVGTAYSQTAGTANCTSPVFSVSAGSLPGGLSLNTGTGAITGTPTTFVGSPFSFSIQVTDGTTNPVQAYSVAIAGTCAITTVSVPAGVVGIAYGPQTIATTGCTSPTFTVSAGALPGGLTMTAGVISGTPTTSVGSPFALSITASSATTGNATASLPITIAPACLITTASLPAGTVGVAYSQTVTNSGCASPTYSVVSGTLPAGVALSNTATGAITGTPTTVTGSPFTFTVGISDARGTPSQAYTVSIAAALLAPVITAGPTAAGNSPSSVQVTWTTDVASSSQGKCGTGSGGPYTTAATPIVYAAPTGLGKGVTTHVLAITGLPSPSTLYHCVVLSAQSGGAIVTSIDISATTLAAVVSTPVAISYVSPVTRYDDQFSGLGGLPNNGRSFSGDTNYCAWADDGNSYCTEADSYGVTPGNVPVSSQVGFSKWPTATDLTYLNISMVSTATATLGQLNAANSPGYPDSKWAPGTPIAVRGLLYYPIMRYGATPVCCMSILISNDHGVTTQSPEHNLSGPGYTGVTTADAPTSGNAMINAQNVPGLNIWFIQHCQDHSMNCTWVANADGYVYGLGFAQAAAFTVPGARKYVLMRIRIEHLLIQDATKIQFYIGTGIGNDGLFDAAWGTSAAWLASGPSVTGLFTEINMGTHPQMVFLPDFNRYVTVGWLFTELGTSAGGAIISDVGPYPWNVSTQIATIPRDHSHLNFAFTFQQFHLESYIKRTGLAASIKIAGNGLYTGGFSNNPNSDEYSPHVYEVGLAQRVAIPTRSVLSQAGGRNTHIANGLDLFYGFQGCTNLPSVSDLSPNGALNHKYDATGLTLACDQHGMINFGRWTGMQPGCFPACATPLNYTLATPYNVALGDFTAAVVFAHYPNSLPTVSGEMVLDKTDFQLARSSTTANLWTLKVGATTSSPFALPTDVVAGGTTWPALFIRRTGSTVNVYSSAGIAASGPLTVLATFSDGTPLGANALNIGATFRGTMSELLVWNRALGDSELSREMSAVRGDMRRRGLILP